MQSIHQNDCRVHRNCRMCKGSGLNPTLVIPNNSLDNQPKTNVRPLKLDLDKKTCVSAFLTF